MVTPRYCGGFAVVLAMASLGLAPKIKPPKPGPVPILPAEEVWFAEFEAPPAANASMDDERVYVGLQTLGIHPPARPGRSERAGAQRRDASAARCRRSAPHRDA